MSTRPRPRPKPRLRTATAPTSVPPTSSPSETPVPRTSPSPSQPAVSPVVPAEEVDEDARFFRNRGRSWQSWKRLEKKADANDARKSKAFSDEDSGVEVDGPSTPKRKPKRKTAKKQTMPDWTKDIKAILVDSSDDENDIILQRMNDSTPNASDVQEDRTPRRANKRQRSRSRSITPPPELSAYTIQHARETVRRMLAGPARAPSPTIIEDDPIEDINLDPELASIARRVQIEANRQKSFTPARSRSPTPVDLGGPEDVLIKVRWKPHPLNPNGRPGVWAFKMRRNDPFRPLFDSAADQAEILSENMILSYDGKRIFPSASPHGIGIWAEAELEACDKVTYEYMRSNRHATPANDQTHHIRDPSPSRARSPSIITLDDESATGTEVESDEEDDDKFKVILRSSIGKDVSLTVRQTTKCSAILKAFLKKAGIADKYPSTTAKGRGRKKKATGPSLVVDGEKLNPDDEIGKAELEDGDLLEVTGL
ncbi:hypothetical protein PHLCEN_2v12202 [Hermanssonia centrifuga]|uniref:Rad60/SUMO-like domain-containing protein n=1 Tax=Hermanssonia centrifuga TaxID=98765 RepID=A0A2R6NJ06_9APHY|nr:hypothetical protein PHLCEN_2v12202 [Hermanssonia centrifuga]